MESQDIRINQWGADNSFSWDKKDLIRFGKGGVDDAEDAEVILHEYGHAIHDAQVAGFGSARRRARSARASATTGPSRSPNVSRRRPTPPCVADWDAVSYTSTVPHCLRRIDTNLHYPEDLDGRVHHDGQIWSRALWDIRQRARARKADTLILEAQFDFAPDTTMPDAAAATVAAALELYGTGGCGHRARRLRGTRFAVT